MNSHYNYCHEQGRGGGMMIRRSRFVLLWLLICSSLAASEKASVPAATSTTTRSLASSSSSSFKMKSSSSSSSSALDYYPVPPFRMTFQSTQISPYSFLGTQLSLELQTTMDNYLIAYWQKNRYNPAIPTPLKWLQKFHLQVRKIGIVPYTPPGSRLLFLRRHRRRQLQFSPGQQSQQQQSQPQQVLQVEFYGNASFTRPSSSLSSSTVLNQTAVLLMETMLNQLLEMATSPIQLQLLQQELTYLSVEPILKACTNITVQLDIDHLLTAAVTSTATATNDSSSSTVTTIHALIITLVLFCTAVFMIALFVLGRHRNNSNNNKHVILSHHFNMGGNDELYDHSGRGGGSGSGIHSPLAATGGLDSSQQQHHSPEVFKILEESDRYLSKHRPDLFRALQSTTNNNNNSGIQNPFSYLYQTLWKRDPPQPPATATLSRSRSSSYYRKRSSFHLPDDTRIIKASGSIDQDDHHPHGTDPSTTSASAAASTLSWDGTGFTPLSTWVRWATGGWTSGGGDHNDGTSAISPTHPPPPFPLMTVNLNDDDNNNEYDDEDLLYRSGGGCDGVFRYDLEPSLACDEDPTNYPFAYRDFPRHDGTPCLIFEIGDDDDDDNADVVAGGGEGGGGGDPATATTNDGGGGDDKDLFGSWKSMLKRNSLSKPDLLAYFSNSSNNNNPDTAAAITNSNSNGNSAQDEKRSLTKGFILNGVDSVSDDDLHRMLEQHAKDHYISRSQRRANGGTFPTDPDAEEDFKPHLERLLASRFRQYEKRSILERHREARQKERDEAAAAVVAARSHHSDDDDDEAFDEEEDYDEEFDEEDDEDNDEGQHMMNRRASQRQLDMERDISALEDSISPRSGRVPRKSCPAPPLAAAAAPASAAESHPAPATFNPWSSNSSFQSLVYVPPPPASSPYVPPPPASSPYVPPPPPPSSFEEKSKSGGSAASARTTPSKMAQFAGASGHRRKASLDVRSSVEYTLDFAGNTPPKEDEKDFDLKKLRDAYKDFNAPSMDELLGSNSSLDIAKVRAAFASTNAPSMDELREIPVPQEPLEEFLQKGLMALDSMSKRSSSNSVVDDNTAAPQIVSDGVFDRDPLPGVPSHKFSTPSGRRRRKNKHERSLSDTNYDWGVPQRSSSSHTHRSDNGDISYTRQPQPQKHHKRTASYTEEAMLRNDIAHSQQQQHKRTPSFTEDVMVHGIYAQTRHDKFMFDVNKEEKMMH